MIMFIVIVLPCSLFADFTEPVKLVGDGASMWIWPVEVSFPVQTTLASRDVRVLVDMVCLHGTPAPSSVMKLDRLNFSLVMQLFVTLECGLNMLFIAASIWALCSGVILLVSIAGIWPATLEVDVISHRPILTSSAGAWARAM